jgi:hypothetical protein
MLLVKRTAKTIYGLAAMVKDAAGNIGGGMDAC